MGLIPLIRQKRNQIILFRKNKDLSGEGFKCRGGFESPSHQICHVVAESKHRQIFITN